jgi:hypothetical protein
MGDPMKRRRYTVLEVTFTLFEAVAALVVCAAVAAELWLVMFVVFGTAPQ